MCGIAGMAGSRKIEPLRWQRILEALRNRGPDDQGTWESAGVSLGATRLCIIDPSARGRQPMRDPESGLTIVHNGEVYNYVEIRRELEAKGYRFRSATDTEVILCAYREWGEECLARFNGMFAFAIWCDRTRSLFFARDRLGVKPFYYRQGDGWFCFASEVKALLEMDLPRPGLNLEALAFYLQFRHNDLEETIFQGIFKLAPAHAGRWRDGRLEIRRYWELATDPTPDSERQQIEKVHDLVRDSVRLRLRSDFSVGLFLSGGVDSSGLLGAICAETERPVHTFNAGLEGLNATRNIGVLEARFGNLHHPVRTEADIASTWPRIVRAYDELNADPTSLPMYQLAEAAKREVKVVCSGEGADELFGGYERASILLWAYTVDPYLPARALSWLPGLLGRVPPAWGNLFFRYFSIIVPEGLDRLREFLRNLNDPRRAYLAVQSIMLPRETIELFRPEHARTLDPEKTLYGLMAPCFRGQAGVGAVEDMLRFELLNRLHTDLLMKCDAMTMAHGLECRVPYLDHRLVEYAASIPVRANIRLLENKRILRQALSRLVPRSVARTPKENFFVPIHNWLNELRGWIHTLLDPAAVRRQGIFDERRVAQVVDRYRTGKLYHARVLWNLMNFQIWHKIYMEGMDPEALGELLSRS